MLSSLRSFCTLLAGKAARSKRRHHLVIEALEDRVVPSLSSRDEDAFHVNLTTKGIQSRPVSASSSNGNVAIAWDSDLEKGDSKGSAVFVRLFRPDGTPLSRTEIRVAGGLSQNVGQAAIAMNNLGRFVVCWTVTDSRGNADVSAARFDASGRARGNVIKVASTALAETEASVAMDDAGNFVITCTRTTSAKNDDVLAQRFSDAGVKRGSLIKVATKSVLERDGRVAMPSGAGANFFVAYREVENIELKRYDFASGNLVQRYEIATGAGTRRHPALTVDDRGNAVVTWQALYGPNDYDIWARRVLRGAKPGKAIPIEAGSSSDTFCAVATDASGESYVVTYFSQAGPDDVSSAKGSLFAVEVDLHDRIADKILLGDFSTVSVPTISRRIDHGDDHRYVIAYVDVDQPQDEKFGIFAHSVSWQP